MKENEEEIFFTMKVYATTKNGKINKLKYSVDLHPPFEASMKTIQPYMSPIVKKNMPIFAKIFNNVIEVFKYIADPAGFNPKSKASEGFRGDEQKTLAQAIKLSKGKINHITYEKNSPPYIGVGAVFNSTGNGDMRPPDPS